MKKDAREKLNKFYNYLYASGSSEKTVKIYQNHLDRFFEYKEITPENVDVDGISNYLNHLSKDIEKKSTHWEIPRKRISVNTQNLFISAMVSFLEYLGIETRTMKQIKKIRKSTKTRHTKDPVHLTREETQKMLSIEDAGSDELVWRNRLILSLLYESGLRVSELVNLKMSDLALIDFKDELITISSKGDRVRKVAINGGWKRQYVNKYLDEYDIEGRGSDYLFSTTTGSQLSTMTIWKIVKNRAEKAGIKRYGKFVHPHNLRSTFCSEVLEAGGLEVAQDLMGHSTPATTRIYAKPSDKKLLDAKRPKL